MFSPGTSSSKPVSHRLLSSLTRSHSVKFAVFFLVACTIYLAKYSYLPFELEDPSLHDVQSSRLRSTCPPRSYAAGEWVPRTPRTSRTHLQAWSDVYDFLGFEGCASTREVLWHLGVDNARVWDRFPGVSSWQWQPPSECQVRDLDPAALVKDLVERGGWLLVGGSAHISQVLTLGVKDSRKGYLPAMPPKKKTKNTHSVSESSSKTAITAKGHAARGRNVRGRRGGLQDMPKMPLDILFEIFTHLHPRDLLNLARTTKDFRALLMSRNAANFWQNARRQVEGLPDKPAHLSEPAYANLLFTTHCHNCLKGGAHVTPYWEISARYCASCRRELFTNNCDDAFKPIWLEFEVEPRSIVDSVRMQSNYARGLWYHKVELEKIKREWKSLATKEQKMQYIEDRKKYIAQCREMDDQLGRWHNGLKRRAAAESDSVRESRYRAVVAKLRQEGFGEELDRMNKQTLNGLYGLDGVSRATKLTDKGWATIRGSVVEYVEKFKSERLSKERTEMLDSRLLSLKYVVSALQHAKWEADSKNHLFAGLADFAYMPEVRSMIEGTSADVTKEVIETNLKEILPGLMDGWVEARRSEVTDLLRKELKMDSEAAPGSPELLQLALASFRCTSCRANGLRWPEVAEHRCGYWYNHPGKDLYDQRVKSRVGRRTVDVPFLGVKHLAIHCRIAYTRDIISLCGANPDTVTYAGMNECAVRLACRRCATYTKQEVFDWKAAITHDLKEHWNSGPDPYPGRWMVLSKENAAKAKVFEMAFEAKPVDPHEPGYSDRVYDYHCGWCVYTGGMPSMYSHLEQTHGRSRSKIKLDSDFYMREPYRWDIWMFSQVFADSKAEKDAVAGSRAFFASF